MEAWLRVGSICCSVDRADGKWYMKIWSQIGLSSLLISNLFGLSGSYNYMDFGISLGC